jgi:hypothetical protein
LFSNDGVFCKYRFRTHFQLTLAEALAGDGLEEKLIVRSIGICEDVLKTDSTTFPHQLRAYQVLAKIATIRRPRQYDAARRYAILIRELISTTMKDQPLDDGTKIMLAWAVSTLGWVDYKLRRTSTATGGNESAALASARKQLELSVSMDPTSVEALTRLGRIQWASGGELREGKDGAYASFLRAAQLDNTNTQAFTYLGHYSLQVTKNKQKAKG